VLTSFDLRNATDLQMVTVLFAAMSMVGGQVSEESKQSEAQCMNYLALLS
jgi:hypothetical protein